MRRREAGVPIVSMRSVLLLLSALAAMPGLAPVAARAQQVVRPSLVDSFRLGTGGDTLCQVQRSPSDPVASGLFDRGYGLVCRDAAAPIGRLYALREDRGGGALQRLAAARNGLTDCHDAAPATLADAGTAAVRTCRTADGVGYDTLAITKGTYGVRGGGARRLPLGAGTRPAHAGRRPHRTGHDHRRDHQPGGRGQLRADPGGQPRSGARACRGLSPQQQRQLCRGVRVLRHAAPAQHRDRGERQHRDAAGRVSHQSRAPAVGPRQFRRGRRACSRRPPPRCPTTPSRSASSATTARSTCSTGTARARRWSLLDTPAAAARRRGDIGRDRPRHRDRAQRPGSARRRARHRQRRRD